MKHAVVTGGAGFIGSHLVHKLYRTGWQVTVIDDLSSGKRSNLEGMPEGVAGAGKVTLVEGTVLDPGLLNACLAGVDLVFHLAALVSVPGSIKDPLATHSVNLTGTLNVLQAAAEGGAGKVVFFSSAAVYGDTEINPQREDLATRPLSPYAVTKLAGEYYGSVFTSVHQLPVVCIRPFNVFGPGQPPDSPYASVIPLFISNVLQGKSPVIFGDGLQTRDFIYVKDVVAAAVLTAERGAPGVYNVGTGQAVTVTQLAEMVLSVIGSPLQPTYREERPGDIKHSRADVTRLNGLGFKPGFTFGQGIEETVRHLRQELRVPSLPA